MVIVVDEVTKEWVVQVQKVYYCKKDHEPVAVMDQPVCPVCEDTMEEIGWFETHEKDTRTTEGQHIKSETASG